MNVRIWIRQIEILIVSICGIAAVSWDKIPFSYSIILILGIIASEGISGLWSDRHHMTRYQLLVYWLLTALCVADFTFEFIVVLSNQRYYFLLYLTFALNLLVSIINLAMLYKDMHRNK